MKKYLIVLSVFVVLALFISGCANQGSTQTNQQNQSQQTQQTQQNQTTQQQNQIVLTQEEKQLAIDKLGSGRVAISRTMKKLGVGDGYVIGLAIKNIYYKPAKFNIQMNFLEANRFFKGGSEPLTATVDDDTIMSWFDYNKEITLNSQEQTVVPIKIIIGNKINSEMDTPLNSSYQFSVDVKQDENGFLKDYQLSGIKFTVTVG